MPRLNDLYGFVTPYAVATAVFVGVNLMLTLAMIRLASGPGVLTTAQLGGLSRFAVAYLGSGVLGLVTACLGDLRSLLSGAAPGTGHGGPSRPSACPARRLRGLGGRPRNCPKRGLRLHGALRHPG